MARIPGISASTNATAELPNSYASPDAFGSQIGRSLQGLGDALGDATRPLNRMAQEERERTKSSNVANAVAQSDFSKRYLDLQAAQPAGAPGFYDTVRGEYTKYVDDYTGKIQDPEERLATRTKLMADLPRYGAQAAAHEKNAAASYAKTNADNSLNALNNQMRADPSRENFASVVERANGVIDSSSAIPAEAREAYKIQNTQNLAMSRFQSLNAAAKTVDEVDGIQKDLLDPEAGWQQKMSAADYNTMLGNLKTNRTSLATQADAQASAALSSAEERTKALQIIPPEELQASFDLARQSKNPALLWRVQELKAKQDVLATEGRLPPDAMRQRIGAASGNNGVGYPGLPPQLADAINAGVGSVGGRVSATYMGATALREYGGQMKPGPDGTINWGVQASTSSATGVFQFIGKTWLGEVKSSPAVAAAIGVKPGMSDDAILALRADPKASAIVMASFTLKNQAALEAAFPGRPVTDTDLYAAHFLGSGGAIEFIRAYRADPSQSAAGVVPDAAKANNRVFYGEGGRPKSVGEVYAAMTRSMGAQPGRADAVRNETRQQVLNDTTKRLAEDPISLAASKGVIAATPLNGPEDYATRGVAAQQAAAYYSVPLADMKPLTQEEATKAAAVVKDGTADDVLRLMSNIQAMGGQMATAAYKQIGQTDAVFSHAAGLAADQGNTQVAGDIVRGQKRLRDDKEAVTAALGGRGYEADAIQKFTSIVGGSLNRLDDRSRDAIREAALAHYVQTQVATGATTGKIDRSGYEASVKAVLGNSVGTVNGETTLLPKGVDAATMERAVDNLTAADLVTLSVDGRAPMDSRGRAVSAAEISREGRFRAIGGGIYSIQMGDGKQLISGVDGRGNALVYRMRPDAASLKAMAARDGAPPPAQLVPDVSGAM